MEKYIFPLNDKPSRIFSDMHFSVKTTVINCATRVYKNKCQQTKN